MTEQEKHTQGIPLPDAPEPAPDLLKERKWWGTSTEGLLLDFTMPYEPPHWTLSHNGICFAKRGDLHIVGGKAGHGKTAFMSQIMATILSGRFGGLQCEIQNEQPTVLYIDTEQSIDDTIAIKNRVCTLAGMNYMEKQQRFVVARLRDTTQAELRYKQILQLMWDINPTVVFIDGLLDIVTYYNEQKECSEIIRELMAYATAKNMSMWCVLHENPMTDKLVGSLGSIAERKVTEVFIIRKHKGPHMDKRFQNMPNVFFEVKQTKARGKDQEDWYFVIRDGDMGWPLPAEIDIEKMNNPNGPLTSTDSDTLKQIVKALLEFMSPPKSEYYTNIRNELKNRLRVGQSKANKLFTDANDAGVFHAPIQGRYTLNMQQCDAILNDLPFASSE